ncbi:uncharacterized protein SAPINGB_P004427 [Magnusiomyces paraingens]|uniref:Uncharacterized protein n=1 Tax=Magnusiomyces paraingens TaxID=2606893 RepID=A0A5E8BZJ1_9ASCO|nr:uncharacterized protein SAPINGB_P004427 [Saprochaete ingens]VVT55100.1 unnamed protein product [Saprochaete ingens]
MLRAIRPMPTAARAATRAVRAASTKAISTPAIIDLESRWEKMTVDEQEDIISQLAERQKGSWTELTPLEKRAAWYISYGTWGPRKPIHPKGEVAEIFKGVGLMVFFGVVLFTGARLISEGDGITATKEWAEASHEILKEQKANPFRGFNQVTK